MRKSFEDLVDLCFKELNGNNELISISIVVKDGNSGEIRVYNSDEYGGICEYNEK